MQSALELLSQSCEGHPHLRVKIAVDCVEKGYATHHQVADFLGLGIERWKEFYDNFQIGDASRIPKDLRNVVPPKDLRFLTGFTDEQLNILERALDVPLLMAESLDERHPLLQELRVLLVLGALLLGKHNQFKSYSLRVVW